MKKLIAIIMATVMLGSISVYAETIDFSGMSVDELLVIRDQVDEAIYAQGGQVILPFGNYTVGKDIAAGTYVIEPHNEDGHQWDSAWKIRIYKSAKDKENYDVAHIEYNTAYQNALKKFQNGEKNVEYPIEVDLSIYTTYYNSVSTGEKITFSLEEGQIMSVDKLFDESVELTISKSAGLFME